MSTWEGRCYVNIWSYLSSTIFLLLQVLRPLYFYNLFVETGSQSVSNYTTTTTYLYIHTLIIDGSLKNQTHQYIHICFTIHIYHDPFTIPFCPYILQLILYSKILSKSFLNCKLDSGLTTHFKFLVISRIRSRLCLF